DHQQLNEGEAVALARNGPLSGAHSSLLGGHAHERVIEVAHVVHAGGADVGADGRRPRASGTERLVPSRRDNLEAAGVVELKGIVIVDLRLRVRTAGQEGRAIRVNAGQRGHHAVAVGANAGAEVQVWLRLGADAGLADLAPVAVQVRGVRARTVHRLQ